LKEATMAVTDFKSANLLTQPGPFQAALHLDFQQNALKKGGLCTL
jgi:hypothetical protein